MIYDVTIGEKTWRVELTRVSGAWQCKLDGREIVLDFVPTQNGCGSLLMSGQSYDVRQESTGGEQGIVVGRDHFGVTIRDPRSLRARRRSDTAGDGIKKITAPMPGKVVRILVAAGAEVAAGQSVLVIEAMKMQNELKSPKKGILRKIAVGEGSAVEAGQILAEVE
jgi:biotin carboxyl carrier protein